MANNLTSVGAGSSGTEVKNPSPRVSLAAYCKEYLTKHPEAIPASKEERLAFVKARALEVNIVVTDAQARKVASDLIAVKASKHVFTQITRKSFP